MQTVMILLTAVLACGTTIQCALVDEDGPKLGISPHRFEPQKSLLTRDYIASLNLQKNNETHNYCSAVPLNKQWLLTAAECLETPKYLIFIAAVLACGTTVQGAPIDDASPILGQFPHLLGGSRVNPLHREYAVLLRLQKDYKKYDYCNGVRLNKDWLLTPAECLEKPKYTHVRFAISENGKFTHKYYNLNALKYVIHPKYDANTKEDNIALVAANFNDWPDQSQQIKLPSINGSSEKLTSAAAEVIGFQHTIDPGTKKEIEGVDIFTVEIVTSALCKGFYSRSSLVSEQVCVTPYFTGQPRGLSQEDRGVSLVLKDKTLFGIALHVRPWSGGVDEPIVFHRIHPYLSWIHKVTGIPIQK